MTSPQQQQEFEAAIQLHIQQAVQAALAGMPVPAAPAPRTVNVNAVAVKLPEFWPADPQTWFHQAEAAFRRSNVTVPFTKYDHILMKLPTDVVMSVRDLVNSMQPNTPDSNEQLKAQMQINALGGLVYLQDSKTNQKFLVDTGAAVSVLPHISQNPSSGPPLSGADGKAIPSWGSAKKILNFGIRTFLCTFILAAVSKPILGIDFLSANRLLVDPHFGQVMDATTLDPISGSATDKRRSGLAGSLCHVTPAVRSLLASFPAIVGDGSGTPNPKHGVFHSIETTGRPVFAKARRLDPEKHRIAEAEFQNLEKAGIVRRSNSPWSSPLHMVPKPRWFLETMWRLQTAEFGHQARQVSLTLHSRSLCKTPRMQIFFRGRFGQGIPPGSDFTGRHSENGHYNTIWTVCVCVHAIWLNECSSNFPKVNGPFVPLCAAHIGMGGVKIEKEPRQ
jgi:hypothetical protein